MSIIHLPGMRYMRDSNGQVESIEDHQIDAKKLDLIPQHWKQQQEQEKLTSGFYQHDYSQSAQAYENLLRSRSYLDTTTGLPPPPPPQQQQNHFGFSPQQMYVGSPTYFPMDQQQQQQQQQQQLDLQKRPIRKRRRPPHSYASLIAQAILTSRDQRLTLREIYEWVQTRYPHLYEANETGWQNTIRHNLSLNRCFRKLPRLSQDSAGKGKGSKGGYWTVDLEQLNNTNFGRQILDSGFLGNIEYWHHQQQQQQEQQHQQTTQQQQMSHERVNIVDEIDFNSLVSPFYTSTTVSQGNSQSNSSPSSLNDHRYTTETDDSARMASFLARFSKRPMSSLGSMSSSKTSSVRGSTSPHSPATDMSNTPILSSAQLHQQFHQQKLDMDPLLNPSLMRVNNILN